MNALTIAAAKSFWEELEKIASATTLNFRTDPHDLGMHDKRTGENNRNVAIHHGLPSAVTAGAGTGFAARAIAETSPIRAATPEGRLGIVRRWAGDLAAGGKALANEAEGLADGSRSSVQALMSDPTTRKAILRRAGQGLKGAVIGGTLVGGAQAAKNLYEYSAAKRLAQGPSGRKPDETQ